VLVGSEHIDQSRTRIVGRIDFAVLRPEMVFERKAKDERKATSWELPARYRTRRLQ